MRNLAASVMVFVIKTMQKRTRPNPSLIFSIVFIACIAVGVVTGSCKQYEAKTPLPATSSNPNAETFWTLWTQDQLNITAVQMGATELVHIKGGNITAREKISPPWDARYSPFVNYAASNGFEFLVPSHNKIYYRTKSKSAQWHVLQIEGMPLETRGLAFARTYKNTVIVSFHTYPDDMVYTIDTSSKSPFASAHRVPDNFVVDSKGLLFIDSKHNVMRLSPGNKTPHKFCTLKSDISTSWAHLRLIGEINSAILFQADDKNRAGKRFWGSIDTQGKVKALPTSIFSDVSSTLIRDDVLWLSKSSRDYGSRIVRWDRNGYQEVKLPIPHVPVQSLLPCQDKNSVIVRSEDTAPERMYVARVKYDATLKVSPVKTNHWQSSSLWSSAASGNTIWVGDRNGSLERLNFP